MGMKEAALAFVTLCVIAVLSVFLFLPDSLPSESDARTEAVTKAAASAAEVAVFFDMLDRDDVAGVRSLLQRYPELIAERAIAHGELPLHHARSLNMARVLLDAGADGNGRDREFDARPVRWAVANHRAEIAALLESRFGGDGDVFYFAAAGKVTPLAEALKKNPALIGSPTGAREVFGQGRYLLHIAAEFQQLDAATTLLNAGADPNAVSGRRGTTPLHEAAGGGNGKLLQLLIDRGGLVSAKDAEAHQPLWHAAVGGDVQAVEILLKAGAVPEQGIVSAVRDASDGTSASRYDVIANALITAGARD